MNRSFRAQESQMQATVQRRHQERKQTGTMVKEKEEELALFLEMRKREKERDNLLLQNAEELDPTLGSKPGSSPIFKIVQSIPARKTSTDDFLNSDNDKNDYDWLLTPPGTPLFPSLERESQKTVMSQIGSPNARTSILKSRLANSHAESTSRSSLVSRQSTLSSGLNSSSAGIRRPSSSGGASSTSSRPPTPTVRHTLPATTKHLRPSTPTSRATLPSSKTTAPPTKPSNPSARSSTPTSRSNTSARSSTPTSRPNMSARSSTPTSRPTMSTSTVQASTSITRSATPTRRPSTPSSISKVSAPPSRPSSVTKSRPTTMKNPIPLQGSSPKVKSRPWKPSEMPGFSLDAPPNLRTSMPERPVSASRTRPGAPSARSSSVDPPPNLRTSMASRPVSASRGRPGGPSARSSSVEPSYNGRPRRQSCSPSRGQPPNGHSSRSSVPAISRAHSNGSDNVSPVLIGTKMVERVVNMRKLAPPKQDDKRLSHNDPMGKSSSSPDSSGFGRTLSKKSLDMALRHMDIRRRVPGSLRPLMTNIPASSMYSVRSGPPRSRTVSVSDSPLATSSNACSEQSVNNTPLYFDDDVGSERGYISSPASQHGRCSIESVNPENPEI